VKYLNPRPQQEILPAELYDELDGYIEQFGLHEEESRKKAFLIQFLHKAQDIFGYLPEEVQLHVANTLGIHHAEVSGVISFYNYFSTTPKGTYRINVCMGTACYVKGAEKVLQEFERILGIRTGGVTDDGQFSIESLRCVGACGLAPVVMINEKAYGNVKPEDVQEILAHYLVAV
jgi:NADH:ubiquinone oxidoreductase subunit E